MQAADRYARWKATCTRSGLTGIASIMFVLQAVVWSASARADGQEETQDGRATVVWLSIDGLRPDYVDRARTPTFDRLMRDGAYSRKLVPAFPSLTFSSHTTQATGVQVREHGVPANSFYDADRRRVYRYPPFSSLIGSEPIWFTATRQQRRVAVFDWPMAHAQREPLQTAYFQERFDSRMSDRERLEQLLQIWTSDSHDEPLRLLMTWIGEIDRIGHRHGPDSAEVERAVEETDQLLAWFTPQVRRLWSRSSQPDDQLYLLLTTDHGMSEVHTLVHPIHLTSIDDRREDLTLVTSGNVAHLHFDQLEQENRKQEIARVMTALQRFDFARGYQRHQLPDRWGYDHPTRVGDIVIVLKTGYTFSRNAESVTSDVSVSGGPLGMHGYDPHDDPNMLGLAVFFRWPVPLGGRRIEQIDSLQLHPTVAELLEIEPAEAARRSPVALEGKGEADRGK